MWEVSFGKMYNGNYDKSNISTICFSICDNNIVISSITFIDNNNFENNPIIITKEEAIEIATNKEKKNLVIWKYQILLQIYQLKK